MNILILGAGGREHAFAWKIAQSPLCHSLFVAPGNAGTSDVATNLPISVNDFDAIAEAAIQHQIDLLLVGPEEPLVRGIRDYFESKAHLSHIRLIGPGSSGARLEGSKDFSKQFMHQYGIPTAASRTFTPEELADGLAYLSNHALPIVLKADGLAAGKGVIIAETIQHAQDTLREMLVDQKFGAASSKVVIEEYLQGIELSVFVLTDGKNYKILPEAKDYKRIGEQDTGLNTGGMGAVSPVPFADAAFMRKVEERVIRPTIAGLQAENIPYTGFVFIGLMNVEGEPYVIEYNARMGDPETEVVIPRIKSDFVSLLKAAADQTLDQAEMVIDTRIATTVMLVSGGYPEEYEKGMVMTGMDAVQDVLVFHAGTKRNAQGQVITDGGRVMALTAVGSSLAEVLEKSKNAANIIQFDQKYFRKDIGFDVSEELTSR